MVTHFRLRSAFILAIACCMLSSLTAAASDPVSSLTVAEKHEKRIIGPVALVAEALTGVEFQARVDTGAKSCSMHVEETQIDDPNPDMRKNIGKRARLRVIDPKTEQEHWIEAKVAGTVIVKNAEDRERRYKVWITLVHEGFEKRVCVTLNDRSDMKYPMLLGRNFLHGDYLVDVAKNEG